MDHMEEGQKGSQSPHPTRNPTLATYPPPCYPVNEAKAPEASDDEEFSDEAEDEDLVVGEDESVAKVTFAPEDPNTTLPMSCGDMKELVRAAECLGKNKVSVRLRNRYINKRYEEGTYNGFRCILVHGQKIYLPTAKLLADLKLYGLVLITKNGMWFVNDIPNLPQYSSVELILALLAKYGIPTEGLQFARKVNPESHKVSWQVRGPAELRNQFKDDIDGKVLDKTFVMNVNPPRKDRYEFLVYRTDGCTLMITRKFLEAIVDEVCTHLKMDAPHPICSPTSAGHKVVFNSAAQLAQFARFTALDNVPRSLTFLAVSEDTKRGMVNISCSFELSGGVGKAAAAGVYRTAMLDSQHKLLMQKILARCESMTPSATKGADKKARRKQRVANAQQVRMDYGRIQQEKLAEEKALYEQSFQ
jgi:hypothetical protein